MKGNAKSVDRATESTAPLQTMKPLPLLPLTVHRQASHPTSDEHSIDDEASELGYLSDSSFSALLRSSSPPTKFNIEALSKYLEELETSTQELDERFERDNVEEAIYGDYFWYYKGFEGDKKLSHRVVVRVE